MEQLNRVWKCETRHQGDWFMSTKVVNPKPSSQRSVLAFRRICAGKSKDCGCDSVTWPRHHRPSAIKPLQHLKQNKHTKKNFDQPPPCLTTISIGPLSLNVGRQMTPSHKVATLAEIPKNENLQCPYPHTVHSLDSPGI